MVIMAVGEDFHMGEQLIDAHPWVRFFGDRVVRTVNPTMEDPTLAFLRNAGADNVLRNALNRNKVQLEDELKALEAAGVSVVKSEVSVCPIPIWGRKDQTSPFEIVDEDIGLQIDSEYIFGVPIIYYDPETREERDMAIDSINSTFTGLAKYVRARRTAGIPPLRDIYTDNQFMYGSTEVGGEPGLILVDVDPYYMRPSFANCRMAIEQVKDTQDHLVRQMLEAPLPD